MSETKKIDYLQEDPPIYGQQWVCLSFLTPENVKMESDVRSVKVRGVYNNEDEARRRCEEIRKFDTDFNVYIAPVGKWLAWCDDPEKASDFNYANDKLNNMMKNYYENQAQAKEMYEKRKNDMISKGIRENEILKKKNERNAKKNKKLTGQISSDRVNNILDECEKESNIVSQVEDNSTLDDELKNAEELYQQMLEQEKEE